MTETEESAPAAITAREAVHPTDELVADIRRYAEGRFAPPGMGPVAPLTDVLVHAQDIRVPLGLADARPVGPWSSVLEFLVSPKARRWFVSGRLPALRYAAGDRHWSYGSGEEVEAPAAALAMAMMGRPARLDALSGHGGTVLSAWVAA